MAPRWSDEGPSGLGVGTDNIAVFTGLPLAWDAFGAKSATFFFRNRDVFAAVEDATFEVFFPASPGTTRAQTLTSPSPFPRRESCREDEALYARSKVALRAPNWFHYWKNALHSTMDQSLPAYTAQPQPGSNANSVPVAVVVCRLPRSSRTCSTIPCQDS